MEEKWQVCTIEQLGSIGRGRSKHRPRNDSILFGGEYPFIQTADVKHSNLYITEFNETYNEIGLAQSKLWDRGTLCITIAANIAETAILGVDACFPDSVVGFKPFEGIADTKYVKYMMDMFKVYMQQISKGTTQDNLSLDKIKRVKFEVPSYKTQLKIVKVLSTLDDAIENNTKRIKLLEQMAENLYKEWFVRFRFPGHENVEFEDSNPRGWIFGNEEVTCIPRNWHFGELSELGEFVRGKNITSDKMEEGNIEVISAGLSPSGYHNKANVIGCSLTISASGANAGYLLYHLKNIWAADCSYYQDEKNIWFVYSALKFLQPVISNMQAGAAQPHVYPKHVNRISMIIPEQRWIEKYCEIVKPMFEEIRTLQDKNGNLIKQRDLLLPHLMSGKLEVK